MIGKVYYYVGVNIKGLTGNTVEVIDQVDVVNSIPVYQVVDENGELHKVFEFNLSRERYIPKVVSIEENRQLLPPSVLTFPTFSPNGRYLYDTGK